MRRALAPALLIPLFALPAFAQPPEPIDPVRNAFPGAFTSPASAASASVGLADRWLGSEPFSNPAIDPQRALAVAPIFALTSRQDLRADNRDFTDGGGNVDLAGAWAALSIRRVALSAYFWQPVLRLEDNSYTVGNETSVGPPAVLTNSTTSREWIAGFGAALPLKRLRLGAALEWNGRNDSYSIHEESGSPTAGDASVDFSGEALGAQFGAHTSWGDSLRTGEIGAALRYRPSIDVSGTQTLNQIAASGTSPVSATRASSWEGGLSARVPLGETFRLLAAAGGGGAQEWTGFGVTAGSTFEWKLAGEFHDARDPWTLRFGGGIEQQSGVPEPRAGVYALGLGWRFKRAVVDVALMHRTLGRPGEPTSYDERFVLGIRVF